MSLINKKVQGIPDADLERMSKAAQKYAPKPKERMAADKELLNKIENLVNEIRTDDDASNRLENLIQEARVYLPGRRRELGQLIPSYNTYEENQLRQAAVVAEQELDKLGRLQGNVPMPIIDKSGLRTHTNYRTDGITGQELVVPYMDPSDRRVVLQTGYGRRFADPNPRAHNSEPSMMNAMKLMGYDTQWNDTGAAGYYGLADLDAKKGDIHKKVDVMIRGANQGQVAVPAYTSLIPIMNNGRPEYSKRGSGAADYVQDQVSQRMKRDGVGPVQAVDSLVADGIVGPFESDRRVGKLLRADSNRVSSPEKVYDNLIVPGYSDSAMKAKGLDAPKRKPTAPQTIHMQDLGVALNALNSGKLSGAVKYNTNYGDDGRSYERLQIKPYFDLKPEMGFVDVTKTHPLTQQLLDESVLRQRLI